MAGGHQADGLAAWWQEHRTLLRGQGDPETACGRSSLDKGCLPFISGDKGRLDPL